MQMIMVEAVALALVLIIDLAQSTKFSKLFLILFMKSRMAPWPLKFLSLLFGDSGINNDNDGGDDDDTVVRGVGALVSVASESNTSSAPPHKSAIHQNAKMPGIIASCGACEAAHVTPP
jgi:hypothetical protein